MKRALRLPARKWRITILPFPYYQDPLTMKTLSLKVPDELATKINAIAKRRQSTKSEVVRNALDAYVASDSKLQKGSALDLAGDLVGSLEGPTDLSHCDAHMHGYGE